jgi:Ras-related protein Rab-11A
MEDEYDIIFKVVIIGDSSVGKTGILSRYLTGEFSDQVKATVGVEFGTKKLTVKDHKTKIQIWDTAGQEKYRSITNAYYKGAKGSLIVYDISKRSTFDNVDRWVKEVKIMGESDMFLILIGNKSDLKDQREVSVDDGLQKAANLGIAFMETSAKTSINVDNSFYYIAENVVNKIISKHAENDGLEDLIIEKSSKVDLSNNIVKESNRKCC